MSRSTVVTAYFINDALLMDGAGRTTKETSRDDEGAIGSRDNLVHCPKQQSTNDGVEQIRRHVDVDNTTQQSNNTRERGKEDGGEMMTGMEGQHSRERGRGGKLRQSGRRRTIINFRMAHWWIEPRIA